jgi:hypothetical protein
VSPGQRSLTTLTSGTSNTDRSHVVPSPRGCGKMKRDSQADELADQWTLLRGERELSANKSGTTRLRSSSQVLPVRGALSTSRVRKYPERLCQTGDLTLPLVTRMFLQGLEGSQPSGFSNVAVSFKRQLLSLGFELSATAGTGFPSGSKSISGAGYRPYIQFPWSHSIAIWCC